MPVLDPEEIRDFFEEIAPGSTSSFLIEDVGERTARVRMNPFDASLTLKCGVERRR